MVNKLYTFLDDSKQLKEDLLAHSMSQLGKIYAKKHGFPENQAANISASIRYKVFNSNEFDDDFRQKMKKERKFHKNNKTD